MSNSSPSVSFVIPVKNDAARLKQCLASIAANPLAASHAEVIVVDNGSYDSSGRVARLAGARIISMAGASVAALRNRGAAEAESDIIAFVDADHEIAPTWMEAAIDAFRSRDIGAAGALYLAPSSGTWVQQMYGVLRGRTRGQADVKWLASGNLVVRRQAFAEVGGFDASLESCEDVDFCRRLSTRGWRVVGDARLLSVHNGDPKTLRNLFTAERWRGRDNLRVTLRDPSGAGMVSALIPMMVFAACVVAIASLASALFVRADTLPLALASAALVCGVSMLRTLRMLTNHSPEWDVDTLLKGFLVALTYDIARAAAVVTRAGHHRSTRLIAPLKEIA